MGKMIIASPRYSDAGVITTSSEDSLLPVVNLLKIQPTEVWESDTLTSVTIDIDLNVKRTVNLIAFLFHNLRQTGTIKITAADTQGGLATPPDDTGNLAAWAQDAPSTSTWHDTNDDADRWAFTRNHFIHYLSTPFARRWFRLSFTDAGNPDGVFRGGRLILDNAWLPSIKFSLLNYVNVGRSIKRRTSGGAVVTTPKPTAPKITATIQSSDNEELWANFDELQKLQKDSADILVIGDRETGPFRHKTIVYGHMILGQPQSFPNWERFEQKMIVEGMI